ncbi:sensor histidine kinase [Polaribacter ponticola]|uniref:histidine kinase n=1 Tax=Polaribacter ponticola TaxID=2978475 RepID=A0ABT5S8U5_9FLAO|nr:sensor histidine kinase [Polaribacter sp. MSW5]MDD7913906.1 sensor histidine kinase [Polaribacter sp. MSW5]
MTNKPKKANFYINKFKKNKVRLYRIKSEYYNKFYKKDSSIFYNEKHLYITDSIYKNHTKKEKTELLDFFSFEDDLISNKYKIQVLEDKESSSSFKVKVLSLLAVFIFIFLLVLIYFYINKNKAQKIILDQKNNLELALNKNKILLKELNHRVKNNLQMISSVLSLQSSKIKEEESKKHFTVAANRIKVLSKIHNSFYNKNELNETDLYNYVTTLKDYLISSIINPEIKAEFNINIKPNIYINSDNKTTLGLIINELITNSFKYAFTKNSQNLISISIIKNDDTYSFSYSDNGKGFNNEEVDKTKSIGLKLILRLVNQLGDEAIISSIDGMNIKFGFTNKKNIS